MKPSGKLLPGILILLSSATLASADVTITVDRNTNDQATAEFKFKRVPPPSKNDAATKAKFSVVDGENDSSSGDLSVLNDGDLPSQEDEPASNFFFSAGTDGGRLLVDLGSAIPIKQVNTYSWHPSTRAAQVYVLYASDGTAPGFKSGPAKETDPAKCGWKLIAKVDTRAKDGDAGGQFGVSIADSGGNLGQYRYLLFDCSETESDDSYGNTFYSEIDVISAAAPPATNSSTNRTGG